MFKISQFIFLVLILFSAFLKAQSANPKAKIKTEGAIVYKNADFDSAVLTYLHEGDELEVSNKLFGGAFYRVRTKSGAIGYVADTDVFKTKSMLSAMPNSADNKKNKSKIEKPNRPEKKRSFQYTKYIGLEYDLVNYRENTMGMRPTEQLSFLGVKLFGPDLAISGAIITQMNFKFYNGAPKFYETATQQPSQGMILMGDFQFITAFPNGPSILAYFGFGPMFRYSNYTLQLKDTATGKVASYGSDEIGLGAIFTLGVGVRTGPVAIRGEVQYIWEELQYLAYSLSLQIPFGNNGSNK